MNRRKNGQTGDRKRKATAPETQENATHPQDAALNGAQKVLREGIGPYSVYTAVYSLVLVCLHLLELYDNQPGRNERYRRLDELAHDFHLLTRIPRT